jgi:hypothetical protein
MLCVTVDTSTTLLTLWSSPAWEANRNHLQSVNISNYCTLFRTLNCLCVNYSYMFRSSSDHHLAVKHPYANPSGIYELRCNKSYVGQSGRSIKIRYKEHIRYIRTNNPTSAYAAHILENRHEYGKEEQTLTLLRQCRKGLRMDAWEHFFIQTMHQQGRLIQDQHANDPNPLYLLLQTQPGQQGKTQSAEQAIVQRTGKLPHSKDAGTNV